MQKNLQPSGMIAGQRRDSLRLIREVFHRERAKYLLWFPASILLAGVFLLPPRLLQFFTEKSSQLDAISGSEFLRLLLGFGIGIALCLWITIFLGGILREWLRLTVSLSLRSDAMRSLLRSRIEEIDRARRGDWMTRLTSDLRNAEQFLTDSLPMQIQDLTIFLGATFLFLHHSGWIAVIPLSAALLLAILNILVQKKMAPVLGEIRELEGSIFQTMLESFEGLRTIRSHLAEASTETRLVLQLRKLKSSGMRIIKTMAGLMGINEFATQLVITALLTLLAYRIQGDKLTAEDALVYPFYINLFLGAAKDLIASAYDWNRFFIEGGRLASLLYQKEAPTDSNERELTVEINSFHSLALIDIESRYTEDSDPVFANLSIKIEKGKIVAITGPSGCGKSTLLEVLAGLRSISKGSLFINEEQLDLTRKVPRQMSTFVEQQPYLFLGSIRENLTLGESGKDDTQIWKALEDLHLDTLIKSRGGLDAELTDRGRNLSVGQQYRLSLCRALLEERPFLLLDEPFAALDPIAVSALIELIHRLAASGLGIVIVTHQMPESLQADEILSMLDSDQQS